MKNVYIGKIRKDLVSGKRYKMKDGIVDVVVDKMLQNCGKTFKFYEYFGKYRSNDIPYNWTDEMFEYIVLEDKGVQYE